MKKILLFLISFLMIACTSKEMATYNGCKYEVETSIFSDTTEISIISTDFRGTDISRAVLETVIDAKKATPLVINLPRATLFKGKDTYRFILSLDGANYLRENCSKMYEGEDIISIMRKDSEIFDRLQ